MINQSTRGNSKMVTFTEAWVMFHVTMCILPVIWVAVWLSSGFSEMQWNGFSVYWTPFEEGIKTFHWHPMLMTVAYGCLMPISIGLLRFKTGVWRTVHIVVNVFTFGFATAAVIIIHKFAEVENHEHVAVTHAVVGVLAYSGLCAQVLFGILMYVLKLGSPLDRIKFTPYHRFLGVVTLIMGTCALTTGVTFDTVFYRDFATNPINKKIVDERGPQFTWSGVAVAFFMFNACNAMMGNFLPQLFAEEKSTNSGYEALTASP